MYSIQHSRLESRDILNPVHYGIVAMRPLATITVSMCGIRVTENVKLLKAQMASIQHSQLQLGDKLNLVH